ncbi:hypothetical protein ACHAXT_010310 [Thalassiosira profunda]
MNRRSLLLLLLAAVAVATLPLCRARAIPLASTVAAGRVNAESNVATKGEGEKRALRVPKLWGRQPDRKEIGEIDSQGASKQSEEAEPSDLNSKSDDGTDEMADQPDSKPDEGDAKDKAEPSDDAITDTVEKDAATGEGDAKDEQTEQPDPSETQPANQTRPGILYLSQPSSPMLPHHARPMMPYPFMPQQAPPPRNKSPSLLSTVLSIFLPRPQNIPPSPYGPPQPPSSPFSPGGNSGLASLILRLALISLGTLIIDFLGMGSHSEAFLPTPAQHYTFERVNDRYRRDGSALRQALESPPPGVPKRRWKRVFGRRRREAVSLMALDETAGATKEQATLDNGGLYNRTVIIVEMKPDGRVGGGMADYLRDTVSFLIEQHRDHVDKRRQDVNSASSRILSPKLLPQYFAASTNSHRSPQGIRTALGTEMEVVLFLDSPGGTVQDYGLASSHLSRLRNEPDVTLSVCVDRVAASGGYMMACQATPGHLFAAPFAMVGSIGVIMETVNVNSLLQKYGVKPISIKAGKNKAPLSGLAEVTQDEMQMAQDDADVIHEAFQQWVAKSRPGVVADKAWMEKVCTGSVFMGNEARDLGLVDQVMTSDEYVSERIAAGDRVLRLIPYKGPQFGLKLSPLDLILSGMAPEGRARLRERLQGLRRGVSRQASSFFRVGAVVGILNQLASMQNRRPDYHWPA